jgi:Spy/CpxP family protein refolding chaperone
MVRRVLSVAVTVATLLLAVSTVQNAHAQQRRGGGMMGMGVSPLGVVGFAPVQKELSLNEDKAAKVKDLANDYRDDMSQQLEGAGLSGRPGDLSAEEREKRETQIAAIRKNVDDKFMPKLNEILDPSQQTRLREIAIQVAGSRALEDPGVVKSLAITKDQQDKIKKLSEEMSHKMREAFASAGGDRTAMRAKMTELRDELTAKSTEVLTKDQQAQFTQMKGKPFDTKSLSSGGRGRRRQKDN